MNILTFDIDPLSMQTLPIAKAVLDKNDREKRFENDDAGPIALASALSDFFGVCHALDVGHQCLDVSQLTEFADYGLDLLDRLAYMRRELGIVEQREDLARVYASLGVWFARRDADLDNLDGIADGFALLTNGLQEPAELTQVADLMEEVVEAASENLKLDEDRSNPWRPWRVLNLNIGVAVTRSLDPQRMEEAFARLVHRLPHDMPGFFADGTRQLASQEVPDAVREVMQRFAEQWPVGNAH